MKTSLLIICILLTQAFTYAQDEPWQQQLIDSIPILSYNTTEFIDGKLYVFGGLSTIEGSVFNVDVWVLNFEENTWEKQPLPPEHPAARAKHAAAAKDGKLYIFGGETAVGTTTDAWGYDPLANTWEQQPFAQAGTYEENPKHYHQACTGENNIWITGGIDLVTGQATGSIWGYDPLTKTWTSGVDCPSPRYGHACYYNDGKVTILAGRRGNDLLDDAWEYNVSLNTWSQSTIPPLPEAVKFPSYCSNGEVVWVSGGTKKADDGSFVNSTSTYHRPIEPVAIVEPWVKLSDCPGFAFSNAAWVGDSIKSASSEIADYEVLVYGVKENEAGELIGETWLYNSANESSSSLLEFGIGTSVSIYPTYTNAKVNIQANQKIQEIAVYNLQGQLILQQHTNNTELSIDLGGNAKGFYYIRVKANKIYSGAKVMVF